MWNLLLNVKGLRYNPSVSLRLPAPFSREPKISLPFRGGEPAQLVEGYSVKSFAWCKRFMEVPLSHLRLASSAQGTPYGCPKGEPE